MDIIKVVINREFGGFGLSDAGYVRYAELKGIKIYKKYRKHYIEYFTEPADPATGEFDYEYFFYCMDFERADPLLVQTVEELGDKANGEFALLEVVSIPKGTAYRIEEYDGLESIETRDLIDWKIA